MITVYGVYDEQGYLVDLEDWTDKDFATLLASKLGTKLHEYNVPSFCWRPRIPRSIRT